VSARQPSTLSTGIRDTPPTVNDPVPRDTISRRPLSVVPPARKRRAWVAKPDPAAGIVGPKIVYDDDPKRIWYGGGGFFPFAGIPRHENIRMIDGSFPEHGGETLWVSGCAMLVRREVIDAVGLLDPSYRIYCEDVDFCLRARRAGWKCLYEPLARVRHKVSHSSGGGMTPFKIENRIASTFLLFRRFKPLWWRILMIPLQAALFVLLAVGLLLGGRFGLLRGAVRGAGRVVRRA